MAYRMVPMPMTLSDLEGQFCCLKPFYLPYLRKYSMYYLWHVYSWIGKCRRCL